MKDVLFVVGLVAVLIGVALYDYRASLILGGVVFVGLAVAGYLRGASSHDPEQDTRGTPFQGH